MKRENFKGVKRADRRMVRSIRQAHKSIRRTVRGAAVLLFPVIDTIYLDKPSVVRYCRHS